MLINIKSVSIKIKRKQKHNASVICSEKTARDTFYGKSLALFTNKKGIAISLRRGSYSVTQLYRGCYFKFMKILINPL